MKASSILPFLMVPALALASVGCASNAEEEPAADENAATAAAGVELTSAVGALVVDGKKLCTAALVDVDASARIGSASAHGRQIVFGGTCVGQLQQNGLTGAAVFVTAQSGVSVSSPIVAFDFKSQASAGLAVGILAKPVQNAEPLDIVGTSAIVNAGAHTATVIEANENGLLIGTSTEIHAGVDITLQTQCTSFNFTAQAGVAVGGGVSLRDDGLGAAAFVRINGKLHFAAHIDGQCIAHHFGEAVAHIGGDVLNAANQIDIALNSLGTGKVIAVTHPNQRNAYIKVRMTEHVEAIRVNGQGHLTAQTYDQANNMTAACDKLPLIFVGGPCELRPLDGSGYDKGELVTIHVDTYINIGQVQLTYSTTQEAKTPEHDPASSSQSGGG